MALTVTSGAVAATSATTPSHSVGDLIVVFAYRSNNATAPALGTGFTALANGGANSNSCRLGYRIATGTDNTADPITGWTNATHLHYAIYHTDAAAGSVSPGAVSTVTNGAASTTVTVPAVTLQKTDGTSWVHSAFGQRTATSVGAFTTLSTLTTQGTNPLSRALNTNAGVTSFSSDSATANTSAAFESVTLEIREDIQTGVLTTMQQSDWTTTTTPKTVTFAGCQVGDRITMLAVGDASSSNDVTACTTSTGGTSTGTTGAWTEPAEQLSSVSMDWLSSATATVTGTGDIVVSVARTKVGATGGNWGFYAIRSSADGGIGNIAGPTGNQSGETVSLTVSTESVVMFLSGDWDSATAATAFTPAGAIEVIRSAVANYTPAGAYWRNQTAGTRSYGGSGGGASTRHNCLAIELVAAAGGTQNGVAALSATGSLSTAGVVTKSGAVAMSATATMTTAGVVTQPAAASLSATGTLTGAAVVTKPAAAALTATGTVTAAGSVTSVAAAALSASGTLAAAGTAVGVAATALSSTGTLAASSGGTVSAAADLAAAGTLVAAAGVTGVAAAGLSATGSLSAAGGVSAVAAAVLSGAGSLTAAGSVTAVAVAPLSATGALTAAASAARFGAAALSATGTLTAVSGGLVNAAAALTAAGSLTAAAGIGKIGAAALAGTSSLTVAAETVKFAAAVLAATGALSAAGTVVSVAAVVFAAEGVVTAAGVATGFGVAALTATGVLAAVASVVSSTPTVAPPARTVVVAAESRTLIVPAGPRVVSVPAESRTLEA